MLVAVIAATTIATAQQEPNVFVSETYGCKLTYPKGWLQLPMGSLNGRDGWQYVAAIASVPRHYGVVVLFSNQDMWNVAITEEWAAKNFSPQKAQGLELTHYVVTEIDGKHALIVYGATDSTRGARHTVALMLLPANGYGYLMGVVGPGDEDLEHSSAVREIFNGFSITGTSSVPLVHNDDPNASPADILAGWATPERDSGEVDVTVEGKAGHSNNPLKGSTRGGLTVKKDPRDEPGGMPVMEDLFKFILAGCAVIVVIYFIRKTGKRELNELLEEERRREERLNAGQRKATDGELKGGEARREEGIDEIANKRDDGTSNSGGDPADLNRWAPKDPSGS